MKPKKQQKQLHSFFQPKKKPSPAPLQERRHPTTSASEPDEALRATESPTPPPSESPAPPPSPESESPELESPQESESLQGSEQDNTANTDKENQDTVPPLSSFLMGCKSQDRKGSIQKAKERTFSIQKALREARANGKKLKTNNPQRKLDGSIADPRCDDPDNPKECVACTKTEQYQKRGKVFKGFAHHFSCPHNKDPLGVSFSGWPSLLMIVEERLHLCC